MLEGNVGGIVLQPLSSLKPAVLLVQQVREERNIKYELSRELTTATNNKENFIQYERNNDNCLVFLTKVGLSWKTVC